MSCIESDCRDMLHQEDLTGRLLSSHSVSVLLQVSIAILGGKVSHPGDLVSLLVCMRKDTT